MMERKKIDCIWLDCDESLHETQDDAKLVILRIGQQIFLMFYSVAMLKLHNTCHANTICFQKKNHEIELNPSGFLEYMGIIISLQINSDCYYIINRKKFEEAIDKLMEVQKCSVSAK
ncbi:hypothetical protein ACFL23_00650 [Patescibacteria group bacterium]